MSKLAKIAKQRTAISIHATPKARKSGTQCTQCTQVFQNRDHFDWIPCYFPKGKGVLQSIYMTITSDAV